MSTTSPRSFARRWRVPGRSNKHLASPLPGRRLERICPMIDNTELAIERLAANDAAALAAFFQVLAADAETVRFFHPHPLTAEFAHELCRRQSHARDRFYIARYRGQIAGYLMLRGWEEGFAVPSFGGCVHPVFRGRGLGQTLLAHAIQE